MLISLSKETDFDASPELQKLILLASGMGLENLQKEGSLLPMLVSFKGGQYALGVIAEDGGDPIGMAARHVAELPDGTSSYALIFDGRLSMDDVSFQAVIIQAAERGSSHGHMVFQRYEPTTFAAVGEPEYGGQVEQFLSRSA
jgi:hypothetical protein